VIGGSQSFLSRWTFCGSHGSVPRSRSAIITFLTPEAAMKKLRLNPDALLVQTFDPAAKAQAGKGTVRGHDESNQFTFCFTRQGNTCEPAYTCPECAYTVDPRCPETEAC
jgi:hypothetical protein